MSLKKTVVVTGGAGFIGSYLVKKLVKLEYKVIVIDNFSTGKAENLKDIASKIKVFKVNINSTEEIRKIFSKEKKIDYIFHLAALPRIERANDNPVETHQSNIDGVFNILELARLLKVEKMIFTSSSSIYGIQKKQPLQENFVANPQNLYAAQKLIGEYYCQMYSKVFGVKITTVRLFNVYGPGMRGEGAYQLVFTKWVDQIKNNLPLTIYSDGKQTRDFTYILDAVDGLIKVMKFKQKNMYEIFNIGSGREVSIRDLSALFNHGVKYVEGRKFEERHKKANISKAKRLLRWSPKTNIQKGVEILLKKEELLQ